jgi:hypothetical protein
MDLENRSREEGVKLASSLCCDMIYCNMAASDGPIIARREARMILPVAFPRQFCSVRSASVSRRKPRKCCHDVATVRLKASSSSEKA